MKKLQRNKKNRRQFGKKLPRNSVKIPKNLRKTHANCVRNCAQPLAANGIYFCISIMFSAKNSSLSIMLDKVYTSLSIMLDKVYTSLSIMLDKVYTSLSIWRYQYMIYSCVEK